VVPAGIAAFAIWWLYQIFPFDLGSPGMNDLGRLALVALMLAATVGTIVTAIIGIVDLVRFVVEPSGGSPMLSLTERQEELPCPPSLSS
jgi:hypothetical protein